MAKDITRIVLIIVSVFLIAVNILLIGQNWRLKGTLEKSRRIVTEEGYRFSELTFRSLDGVDEKINLATGHSKTLLLVFSSSCQYCVQQYPYWKETIDSLDSGWRVLAVSSEDDLEKLKAHVDEQKIESIKVGTISVDDMSRARMSFTPMTIALDSKGEVVKVWAGLWTKGFDLR